MNVKNNFLANKKAKRQRKTDYTLDELDAFGRATYKAYLSVLANSPDVVVAPLRGSEPLIKTIHLWANEEGKSSKMPPVFYPRTGQISIAQAGKVVDQTQHSFLKSSSEEEQLREMSRTLDNVIKHASEKRKKRLIITVVDEVRHGGSVSQMVDLIEKVLQRKNPDLKVAINILAIAQQGAPRSKDYIFLKSRYHVKEFVVPRVFTMDSGRYLFPLIKERVGYWPKREVIRLGITRKAIEGRHEMLADLQAWHLIQKGNHNGFGKARASSRLARIPRH